MAREWSSIAPQFRARHNQSQGSMGSWEVAEPAYRFGWEAADWPQYRGRPWAEVADELERTWPDYQRQAGRGVLAEWEGFKRAAQAAYEEAAPARGSASPPPADPLMIVREFLGAYNSKGKASLDTIMASLAPDAEVVFSPVSGTIKGERNLRAAFTGLFADEAGTQVVVNRVIGGPEVVAAEWLERGRNYRTAEDVLRHVAGFFEMSGGRIKAARLYSVRLR